MAAWALLTMLLADIRNGFAYHAGADKDKPLVPVCGINIACATSQTARHRGGLRNQNRKVVFMLLSVPVSVGEVVDKVTILEIKSARIADPDKLANITAELDSLRPLVSGGVFDNDEVIVLTDALRKVNGELWDIEDNIRAEEAAGRFGDRFIELARAVYVTNDRRAELKKQINLATGSQLVEEKSYEDYTGKG
jgi:hypothetical protein